jgi:hypothetical protein
MDQEMTDEAQNERMARARAREIARLRRLFSTDPTVRADAQEALKEAWGYDLPSLRLEELQECPAENCNLMSAKRDGNKEIVTWLLRISDSITTEN